MSEYNIEHIMSKLGENKVTLDIKTNSMNEVMVMKREPADNAFVRFDDMMSKAKSVRPPPQHQPRPPVVPAPSPPTPLDDPLLYAISFYVDHTISLFKGAEVNKKVSVFRQTLRDNLTNHNNAYKKLKLSKKYSLEELYESLTPSRRTAQPLLTYISVLLKKNIHCPPMSPIVYDSGDDNFLYIVPSVVLEDCVVEDKSGFQQVMTATAVDKAKQFAGQNLKKTLLKDLKSIATDLNLKTTKVKDGKRVPLLKEELVEKISALIK